jgi:hypothetical protein
MIQVIRCGRRAVRKEEQIKENYTSPYKVSYIFRCANVNKIFEHNVTGLRSVL